MAFFNKWPTDDFEGVIIIERDTSGHVMRTWSYPDASTDILAVIFSRLPASFAEPTFSRHAKTWHYSFSRSSGLPCAALPSTTGVAVVVLSAGSCAERLLPLAKLLCDRYVSTGSAPAVLAAYLQAATTGRLTRADLGLVDATPAAGDAEAGAVVAAPVWEGAAVPPPHPCGGLAALLASLGVEAVIVWAALISGRRVAVLQSPGGSRAELSRAVRLLPCLLAHRLRADAATAPPSAGYLGSGVAITPLVTLADPGLLLLQGRDASSSSGTGRTEADDPWTRELVARGLALQAAELAPLPSAAAEDPSSPYADAAPLPPACSVSGFVDESVARLGGSHWDVCIQLAGAGGGGGVAVAESRPELSALTSLHKDVAKALVAELAACDAEGAAPAEPLLALLQADARVFEVLRGKGAALVDRLREWFTGGVSPGDAPAALAALTETHALPPPVARFLWSVAAAEPALRRRGPGGSGGGRAAAAAPPAEAAAAAAEEEAGPESARSVVHVVEPPHPAEEEDGEGGAQRHAAFLAQRRRSEHDEAAVMRAAVAAAAAAAADEEEEEEGGDASQQQEQQQWAEGEEGDAA